jgi:hypothetical protein
MMKTIASTIAVTIMILRRVPTKLSHSAALARSISPRRLMMWRPVVCASKSGEGMSPRPCSRARMSSNHCVEPAAITGNSRASSGEASVSTGESWRTRSSFVLRAASSFVSAAGSFDWMNDARRKLPCIRCSVSSATIQA